MMVIEEIKPTNYIGYHMGDVDDFYDNSSESDELNEIIKTLILFDMGFFT